MFALLQVFAVKCKQPCFILVRKIFILSTPEELFGWERICHPGHICGHMCIGPYYSNNMLQCMAFLFCTTSTYKLMRLPEVAWADQIISLLLLVASLHLDHSSMASKQPLGWHGIESATMEICIMCTATNERNPIPTNRI